MRFDLENRHEPVADVDHARVFSRPLHHVRAARRQPLQMDADRFIGAVLAPHHAENAKFGDVRIAAEDFLDARVFVGVRPCSAAICGVTLISVSIISLVVVTAVEAWLLSFSAHLCLGGASVRHAGTRSAEAAAALGLPRATNSRPSSAKSPARRPSRAPTPPRAPDAASAPRTLRSRLHIPAMAASAPFGFASKSSAPASRPSACT